MSGSVLAAGNQNRNEPPTCLHRPVCVGGKGEHNDT
jgi:hypothetical protein